MRHFRLSAWTTIAVAGLCIALIFCALSYAEAPANEEILAAQFLQQFPRIRIGMIEADGNGHQAAAALLIRKLRYIGYKNEIELVYAPNAKRKLEFLLPPFRADGPDEQYLESMNVYAYGYPAHHSHMEPLPFGIVAADYENGQMTLRAQDLNVATLLLIQPSRWPNPTLSSLQGAKVRLHDVHSCWPNKCPMQSDVDLDEILEEQLSHSEKLAAKIDGLKDLFTMVDLEQIDLLSAYGFGVGGTRRLVTLLQAVHLASSRTPYLFVGPVVIGLISNLNEWEWNDILATLKKTPEVLARIKILDITSPSLSEDILSLSKDNIAVVKIGSISQQVWEYLMAVSTLPPTVAGTHGTGFLFQLGRPFIATSPRSEALSRHNSYSRTKLHQRFAQLLPTVTNALENGYVEPIAQFIEMSKGDSLVSYLFKSHSDVISRFPDRTCSALLSAERNLNRLRLRSKVIEIFKNAWPRTKQRLLTFRP